VGSYPQVVDTNNDGLPDIVSGDASGAVWLFRNAGTRTQPNLAVGERVKAGGVPIEGTRRRYEKGADGRFRVISETNAVSGVYSKLHLADWDGDGLRDLLVGQDGPAGQDLVVYRNAGAADRMELEAPVPLALPGPQMSRPSMLLFDWDGDGKTDVLCGTENARIVFFRRTGDGRAPTFAEGADLKLEGPGFEKSYRCRPCVTDWNNDGKPDLLVGNIYSDAKKAGGNVWLFLAK